MVILPALWYVYYDFKNITTVKQLMLCLACSRYFSTFLRDIGIISKLALEAQIVFSRITPLHIYLLNPEMC